MDENSKGKGNVINIPGGPYRPSTIIDRQGLANVEIRERVTKKLQIHDFDSSEKDRSMNFSEEEYQVVRLIATEGVSSGNEPAIRYKAITALAARPSVENFNTISDLARFGEDFYIRGYAMMALGHTALYAHLPILLVGLKSEERFEGSAAARAIENIIRRTSAAGVLAHVKAIGDREGEERFQKILDQVQHGVSRPPEPRKTESNSNVTT